MNISEIRRLVKLVEASDINELEIEEEGARVKIVKRAGNGLAPVQMTMPVSQVESAAPGAPTADQPESPAQVVDSQVKVTSPMVGTFYRAPSPEAPPYVETGDHVKIGQVLCIIEAMKLMNELEAEASGRIVSIAVENAQPVEFGQTLFTIDPD